MRSTRVTQFVAAPRARVYATLLDPAALAHWKVPDGMTAEVHQFEPREGGAVRVSLTYNAPDGVGKTSAQTDTYSGHFVTLIPGTCVVEVDRFESADPALRGAMTSTITLSDVEGGTEIVAVHSDVPFGVSLADNETGWRMALAKLAALAEATGTSTSYDALLHALLDSWDRNNTVLVNLLHAIPEGALDLRQTPTSPSIGGLFMHMHYCRLIFVQEDAPEVAMPVPEGEWRAVRDRAQIAQWLAESARTVSAAVMSRLQSGRPMDTHYDHPILLFQHFIWHEGYHHGQIKLALKLAGQPFDDEEIGPKTWDVWMGKSVLAEGRYRSNRSPPRL